LGSCPNGIKLGVSYCPIEGFRSLYLAQLRAIWTALCRIPRRQASVHVLERLPA
jgi:hypothetical protein